MQLVDEGLLSLDTTVSAVLPDARLGTADVGGQVTVRHLLTHTSGIDGDVFGDLTGVTMPPPPRPADGVPGSGSGPEASEMAGMKGAPGVADLGRYAGRYARTSRRFDVSVRDGRLAMELTMTGNLVDLVGAEPEDLLLYPAECADSSGTRFVLRSRDDEPWAPVSFGQLADGTPYLYMSGRVAPRVS
jgi:hypothetical protein